MTLAYLKFHCGDLVYRPEDLRHVGRVNAVHFNQTIRVLWPGGVRSDEDADAIKKVPRRLRCGCCTAGCTCVEHGTGEACEFHHVHPD